MNLVLPRSKRNLWGLHGADGADGLGIGGGVYNLGTFLADALTALRHNRASTSNDDLFP
jgi:hypothetical protein